MTYTPRETDAVGAEAAPCLEDGRGGLAAGGVLGGRGPIILTSRSDPPAARLASLVLAAIAGQEEQE